MIRTSRRGLGSQKVTSLQLFIATERLYLHDLMKDVGDHGREDLSSFHGFFVLFCFVVNSENGVLNKGALRRSKDQEQNVTRMSTKASKITTKNGENQ